MNGLRDLPSVHAVLAWPRVAALAARHGHGKVARAAREAVETARRARRGGSTGEDAVVDEARVEARLLVPASTLQPVLNGTGILVHTNLGRAPLAAEAIAAMVEISSGYSTVEYDLDNGKRGDRHGHAAPLLTALTGAEDALVVNNAAAALLLAVAAVARGRQVIVSRGELVEVGGGFRIPDVLAESGAELVEVGTTNRTHLADYERAIGERSALLLKVHRSSFAMVGFTREVPLAELAELGRSRGLPVLHDAGSGCLGGFDRDTDETVASSVRAGADLVVFSGDKLLGGPQAGLLVGRRALVARAREHPLLRAVRPDKATLAALVATLTLHRDDPSRVPVVAMANLSREHLVQRAARLVEALGEIATVALLEARLGGGSTPLLVIPSAGIRLAVPSPDAFVARLRRGSPAVIARASAGAVVVDLRAIPETADEVLRGALSTALLPAAARIDEAD